jgi:predicted enzyme related to lactoylglutathione lyase
MLAPYAGITFLSYADVETGDRFYRKTLGLRLVIDQGWAKVYQIHGSSYLGIVSSESIKTPVGQGVLLSLVVRDVDAWYERLKAEPGIEILSPPTMVRDLPVYSFFFLDPGGYRIEIQAFTTEAGAKTFAAV